MPWVSAQLISYQYLVVIEWQLHAWGWVEQSHCHDVTGQGVDQSVSCGLQGTSAPCLEKLLLSCTDVHICRSVSLIFSLSPLPAGSSQHFSPFLNLTEAQTASFMDQLCLVAGPFWSWNWLWSDKDRCWALLTKATHETSRYQNLTA